MESNMKKVKIRIDGKEIFVDEGISILEAAQQNGVHIPTLCHHAALSSWGGCRICVVEVDKGPRLAASCVTPVRGEMEIVTSNERIAESRRAVLEFLFAERNHNCMFCPQSGDCELQDLAYELQMDHLTVSQSFKEYPTDVTSEYMVIDHNRCILCGRCVRACREIAGTHVLNFQNRGPQSLIGFDLNETREESTCYECGVCMQVCPTGAIYNRYRTHYAVKGHDKDWQTVESFCPQCGLLCPTVSVVKDNNLLEIDGRLLGQNNRPDKGQLCYKGRFEPCKTMDNRRLHPMIRHKDGTWAVETWEATSGLMIDKLNRIKKAQGADGLFGLVSSQCSNEELLFFKELTSNGLKAGYVDTLDGHYFRVVSTAWKYIESPHKEASWKFIPDADFILMIGANPHGSQPVLASLIRRSVQEKKAKLVTIGPIDPMYPLSSCYLPIKDEKLSSLLEALLAGTIRRLEKAPSGLTGEKNPDDLAKVNIPDTLNKLELDEEARNSFHNAIGLFVDSENPLILVGEELIALRNSSALNGIVDFARLKGLLPEEFLRLIVLKPQGNSAGAWKLGVPAEMGITTKNKWRGGLMLLGDQELLPSGILDSLKELDFLAVIGPYLPESLTDKAHAFLPKPLWVEENGTYTSLDGSEFAYKQRVLEPPEGIKDTWQTLLSLAKKGDFNHGFTTWDELRKKTATVMEANGGDGKNI